MALTDSRFNMWRGVLALVHADGVVTDGERQMFGKYFSGLDLSDGQQETLRQEFKTPANQDDILPKITEPVDRADLLNFAHLIFWSDQEMAESENAMYQKLRADALGRMDAQKLAALKAEADARMEAHDAELKKLQAGVSPIVRAMNWLTGR